MVISKRSSVVLANGTFSILFFFSSFHFIETVCAGLSICFCFLFCSITDWTPLYSFRASLYFFFSFFFHLTFLSWATALNLMNNRTSTVALTRCTCIFCVFTFSALITKQLKRNEPIRNFLENVNIWRRNRKKKKQDIFFSSLPTKFSIKVRKRNKKALGWHHVP